MALCAIWHILCHFFGRIILSAREIRVPPQCFFVKYLRSLGGDVDNTLFASNSWYFRNALVRANYRNVAKGVEADDTFLIHFLYNLLFGEHHEMHNRYMLVNPPKEWGEQGKHNTSNSTVVPEVLQPLLRAIGMGECSVREIMETMGLKARANFTSVYLLPAIEQGFVRMLYPDSPRHTRQKYLLSVKGLTWYNEDSRREGYKTLSI